MIELLAAIFRRWRMVVDIRFVERDEIDPEQLLPLPGRRLLGSIADQPAAWDTIDIDRLEAEIERAAREIDVD
ncbi:MAG: hypothetical protein EOS51_18115 [Mesorhizobium sp.]|uniref:hypothetical protein n=1 Tax=unclassified Mesorhizobium TaxID=325217 RepID=UPI000FE69E93|nr:MULTISPECIES: hypothetical protein [unclassified Mesorhizobium]RWC17045.1 MAG: hypothetical protein EOS51_18115 [Mesorhizobium sp.]TGU01261.1 hypothetical protein EN807_16405 [Mesorhizobium sp. M5C.F.Ca.ET.164.01.1.1]